MPQGRLQIRSSLVAVTSLVRSLTHFARSTAHSRSAFTHAYELALDLEWEVLAEMLGLGRTALLGGHPHSLAARQLRRNSDGKRLIGDLGKPLTSLSECSGL